MALARSVGRVASGLPVWRVGVASVMVVSVRGVSRVKLPDDLPMVERRMRHYVPTLGQIVDRHVPQHKAVTPSLFSRAMVTHVKDRVVNATKNLYAVLRLRVRIPGWKPGTFAEGDAQLLYAGLCRELATGNKAALRNITTENYYTELKGHLKRRAEGPQLRVVWHGEQFNSKSLQHRVVMVDKNDKEKQWAQVTVRTTSMQRVDVFDRAGRKVMGDKDGWQHVDDVYVVERPLFNLDNTTWRICGKI